MNNVSDSHRGATAPFVGIFIFEGGIMLKRTLRKGGRFLGDFHLYCLLFITIKCVHSVKTVSNTKYKVQNYVGTNIMFKYTTLQYERIESDIITFILLYRCQLPFVHIHVISRLCLEDIIT